jgi:histidinol phosphatase-like enzyme
MLLAAAESLAIDLGRSWIVGDHASDLAAGQSAGLKGGIHVLSGAGERERTKVHSERGSDFDLLFADHLAGALDLLAEAEARR